jgi:hypothetical protein
MELLRNGKTIATNLDLMGEKENEELCSTLEEIQGSGLGRRNKL